MFGVNCDRNSLGLGCLVVLNFHFMFEVILMIIQLTSIRDKSPEGMEQLYWILFTHAIVLICLLSAFFGIFNDKPFYLIPQITLQICIVVVALVNVLSWICLSHLQVLVLTELRDFLPMQMDIDYVFLYVKILLGCLFLALYFCFLAVVYGYFKKLRNEVKFEKSVLKSVTLSEDLTL